MNFPKPWPKETRDRARLFYFQYVPVEEISKRLEVPAKTISIWARKYKWDLERKGQLAEVLNDTKDQGQKTLAHISKVSLALIYKSLASRAEQQDALTLREAQIVTDIVTKLDRIARLDAGNPTDIIEDSRHVAPITINELRKIVAKDEFIDVIPLKKRRGDTQNEPIEIDPLEPQGNTGPDNPETQ